MDEKTSCQGVLSSQWLHAMFMICDVSFLSSGLGALRRFCLFYLRSSDIAKVEEI